MTDRNRGEAARRHRRSPLWDLSVEDEVREELDFHLEMRIREYRDQGLDESTARERALAGFGDLDRLGADCRRLARLRDRRMGLLDFARDMRQDMELALRQIRRRPAIALTSIAVLAVGIAAVTAVFGVVYPVLLDPLPLPESHRLVSIGVGTGVQGGRQEIVAPLELGVWRDHGGIFQAIAPWLGAGFTIEVDGLPMRVSGLHAGQGLFEVIGTAPRLGRTFVADDFSVDGPSVVLLGSRMWRTHFGSDPDVLGRELRVDGNLLRVVGVLAPELERVFGDLDAVLPMAMTEADFQQRASYLWCLARLAPGVSQPQAQSALDVLQERANALRPADERREAILVSLRDNLVSHYRQRLLLLFAGVGLVLLIACGNVANLLLAEALGRGRELGVRTALGAGRGRILRQLMTESLVLSGAAAVLGVLGAAAAIGVLVRTAPAAVPGLDRAGISPAVLAFAVLVTLLATLLAALAPALRATGRAVLSLRSRGPSWRRERLRPLLVALQVAFTLTLLVASGLLVRSAIREGGTTLGFDPKALLTAQMSLPATAYPSSEVVAGTYRAVIERIARMPGVRAAAGASRVAFAGPGLGLVYLRPEQPERKLNAEFRIVSPGYFATVGAPLLSGRELESGDRAGARLAVVVNRSFAEAMWPDGDAVGRGLITDNAALSNDAGEPLPLEVVGVVADARDYGLRVEVRPSAYISLEQAPPGPWSWIGNSLMLVARTETDPATLVEPLRRAVAEIAPAVPVFNIATMESRLADTLQAGRFNAMLFSVLGLIALVLALGGIYGLTAFFVRQQEYEIGVRLALGSTRRQIVRRIVVRSLAPVAAGAALGLVLNLVAGRLLSAELVGIDPGDPLSSIVVLLLLVGTAWLASVLPAQRAARVEPARALRSE